MPTGDNNNLLVRVRENYMEQVCKVSRAVPNI